jgi:hypothetical protein
MFIYFVIICFAGILGGLGNAIISDNGFLMPKKEPTPNNQFIWRLGVLGNMTIGLIAALLFWL